GKVAIGGMYRRAIGRAAAGQTLILRPDALPCNHKFYHRNEETVSKARLKRQPKALRPLFIRAVGPRSWRTRPRTLLSGQYPSSSNRSSCGHFFTARAVLANSGSIRSTRFLGSFVWAPYREL